MKRRSEMAMKQEELSKQQTWKTTASLSSSSTSHSSKRSLPKDPAPALASSSSNSMPSAISQESVSMETKLSESNGAKMSSSVGESEPPIEAIARRGVQVSLQHRESEPPGEPSTQRVVPTVRELEFSAHLTEQPAVRIDETLCYTQQLDDVQLTWQCGQQNLVNTCYANSCSRL